MHGDSLVKKIFRSEVEGNLMMGRQPASREGKVREYIRETTQEGVTGMEYGREYANCVISFLFTGI